MNSNQREGLKVEAASPAMRLVKSYNAVSVNVVGVVTERALDEVMMPRTILETYDAEHDHRMFVAFSNATRVNNVDVLVNTPDMVAHIKEQLAKDSSGVKVTLDFNVHKEDMSFQSERRLMPSARFAKYSTLEVK